MATPMAVGQTFAVKIWWSTLDQAAVNTLHYNVVTATLNPSTDADLAQFFDATYATALKGLISNKVTYDGIQVQKIWPAPLTADALESTNAGLGTQGNDSAPEQTASLISWYTDFAGAAYRGRLYMPFPPLLGVNTFGRLAAGYQNDLSTLAAAIAGMTVTLTVGGRGATLIPTIWHRLAGVSGIPLAHTNTPIRRFSVGAGFATQKKRGAYGRPNRSPF